MKKSLWIGTSLLIGVCPGLGVAHGRLPVPSRPPQRTESVKNFDCRPFEDDRGGFYLVFVHDTSSGTLPGLVVQHLDAQGNALWPEPMTLTARMDSYDDWDAFPDGQGGGVATWVRGGALFTRHFEASGRITWSDVLALSPSTGTVKTPSGVADASGGAYIVWSQEVYPDRSVLLEQHLNATGQTLWKLADMRVSLRPSDQERPSIVTDGQGGSVIAWNDVLNQSSQAQIQRMDPIGDRIFGDQGLLITAPASLDKEPLTLEPLFNQGHVVFAWTGSQNAVNRTFLQRVDSHGKFLWSPQGIAASVGAKNQWNPVVSGAEDGSLWVAWEDNRDQSRWRGYLTHLASNGSPLPGLREVAITDDGLGGVFAAWFDDRTGSSGLYYQDIDAHGQRRLPSQGVNLIRGLHDPLSPTLVPLGPGRAALVWANHIHQGLWGIYWAVVDNHTF